MDGTRFDELTRRLAAGASRRGVLKGLAAGLAAGLSGVRSGAGAQRVRGQENGAACTRPADCASFLCASGICCDTACTGQCESCATGTCLPVAGPPEPGRTPCPGDGPCAATCDGVTTSHCAAFPGPEVICGDSTCVDGAQTANACAGNGTCHLTTTSCAPFRCEADGLACAAGCVSDEECVAGHHCDDVLCLPNVDLGVPCVEDSDCLSGVCADDVCCAERCGPCQVCNTPGNEGFCGPAPDNGECAEGICCDGGCVDHLTEVANCGECGIVCSGGENGAPICVEGSCSLDCLDGFQLCNGACIPERVCCTGAGEVVCCGYYACELGQPTCRTSCDEDSHCAALEGVRCVEGTCVQEVQEGKFVCADDRQCPTGMMCLAVVELSVFCVATDSCGNDDDCSLGTRCVDGFCTYNYSCADASECIACGEGGDCVPNGLACIDGLCGLDFDLCNPAGPPEQIRVNSPVVQAAAQQAPPVRLRQAPEQVWRALTEPDALAAWAVAADIAPVVGHRFRMRAASSASAASAMDGEVVAVEPNRLLAFTWEGGPLSAPTTVTITLEPDGDGTRLSMRHTSTDGSACQAANELLGARWQLSTLRQALPRYLERQGRSS